MPREAPSSSCTFLDRANKNSRCARNICSMQSCQTSPIFRQIGKDNRPYIGVMLFDYPITGLLDSGSNVTIVGRDGIDVLSHLNLKILPRNFKPVSTADGVEQTVLGLTYLPLMIDDELHLFEALVVPTFNQSFIFGSDFCRKFDLKIDYLKNSWKVQLGNSILNNVGKPDTNVNLIRSEVCSLESLSNKQK